MDSEADSPAVSIEKLTKVFDVPFRKQKVLAVNDISLEVRRGEVYGLIGPNGSGKSTTMKILLGLVRATRGKTRIFGRDSQKVDSRQFVGFLPENPYFYKYLTGAETIRFYGKLCGLRGMQLKNRIDELLELVDLEDARDRRLGGYSKGMLQRIGLAQALVQDPKLVFLDEPTAGVDPAGSRVIRDLIVSLKKRGLTVVLTSHLLEQVQQVCDRVGIMSKGSLKKEGRLQDLLALEDQTEINLRNAPPGVLEKIRELAESSGAEVINVGTSRTTLERLFLEVTDTAPHEEPEYQNPQQRDRNG